MNRPFQICAFTLLTMLAAISPVAAQQYYPFRSSDVPAIVGSFYDAGWSSAAFIDSVTTSLDTTGFIISGSPGDPEAILVFEANGGAPDDFFTSGSGLDLSGDGLPDTFPVAEPLAPNEVPTSPGGEFEYDGGTATYVGTSGATDPIDGSFASGESWFAQYSFSRRLDLSAALSGNVGVRNISLAQNNSALPRTRLFFDYRFFNDVLQGLGSTNRYMIGLERAVCDCGIGSLEVRMPFAATLDSDQTLGGAVVNDMELGDVAFSYKHVLYQGMYSVLSGGIGITLPTADDIRLFTRHGTLAMKLDNRGVHVLPYVAWARMRGPSVFQVFAQLDVDANGDRLSGSLDGRPLARLGDLNDSTRLNIDLAYSNWMYQSDCVHGAGITGVAPFVELHYSGAVGNEDSLTAGGFEVTRGQIDEDRISLTTGMHFRYGQSTLLTPALLLPLQDSSDRQFDAGFALLLNHLF